MYPAYGEQQRGRVSYSHRGDPDSSTELFPAPPATQPETVNPAWLYAPVRQSQPSTHLYPGWTASNSGVRSSQNLSPTYMTAASEGDSDFSAQQATGRSNAGAGLPGSYTASLASPSTIPRKMRNAATGIEDLMVHQDSTGAIRCGIDVSCLATVLTEAGTGLMTCSPTPSLAGGCQACHEPGRGLGVSHIPPNSLLLTIHLSSTQISR